MHIDITINTDDKYLQHAMAMLCSFFESNIKHDVSLHVLQKNLSDYSKQSIKELCTKYSNSVFFYKVDETRLEGVQFRQNRPLTMAAYYRLLLSSLLPFSIHKVLYLDCDMIIKGDVSSLFAIELSNYALAASVDNSPYTSHHREQLHLSVGTPTFCSGIMLVNLDYWRTNNCEVGLIEFAKRKRDIVYLHDQDVMNYYFKNKWFILPPKWNRNAYDLKLPSYGGYKKFDDLEYLFFPKILHYADSFMKPWNLGISCEKRLYEYFLKKSGFENIQYTKISLRGKIFALKIFIKNVLVLKFKRFLYRKALKKYEVYD